EVVFIGRTTDRGGVTMSLLLAVPPAVRLTVMSVALECDAVTTNVAGVPSETTALTDWILMTGAANAVTSERNDMRMPLCATPVGTFVRAAAVWAPVAPMIRPAAVCLP